MTNINLGPLAHGPHAALIHDIAAKCAQDKNIEAIWVGGSLAAGHGDQFSDIDFRIAVNPGHLDQWADPDWNRYLPLAPYGGSYMRFGEQALLHHMVLADGTILDFYVQDTNRRFPEPAVVVLACRNAEYQDKLEQFATPVAKLTRNIEGTAAKQFLVDYWITTHKQMKALARKYDYSPFVGLYFERIALLRGWYMQIAGQDIHARVSLHMLGALHSGMRDRLTQQQQNILGMPSRTPEETVKAIEAIRTEMALVGRQLAETHGFNYPYELEEIAQRLWHDQKESLTQR